MFFSGANRVENELLEAERNSLSARAWVLTFIFECPDADVFADQLHCPQRSAGIEDIERGPFFVGLMNAILNSERPDLLRAAFVNYHRLSEDKSGSISVCSSTLVRHFRVRDAGFCNCPR